METFEILLKIWPVLLTLVGLIAAMAVYAYRTEQHSKSLGALSQGVKEKLYQKDGRSIYMPRTACEICRADCQKVNDSRLVEIRHLFEENNKQLTDIVGFMGEVKEYMKSNR
jgi:hypothetical protein